MISKGILNNITVAKMFLFPCNPTKLVMYSYRYGISFNIIKTYCSRENDMSITSVIADNHKMSLSWIKFLCKKNIKIPNDNKKVNNWLILTNDSTLFKATSNESIAISKYPKYEINRGSLINFLRFKFLKKIGIDITVKKLTMLTVRYWTVALSRTSPNLYV